MDKEARSRKARGSRRKGDDFERLVADLLSDLLGERVVRVLLSGVRGEGDLAGIPAVHCECRKREKNCLHSWYKEELPKADKKGVPLVLIHSKNRSRIFVTMDLQDWADLFREVIR